MSLSTLMLRGCAKSRTLFVARTSSVAFVTPNKNFSQFSIRSVQVCQLHKLNRDALYAWSFRNLSSKPESGSLADQIMQAKQAEEKKDDGKEEPKQGPKPMTKWQKYGYIFFGVTFVGMFITNAVLFCKNFMSFDFSFV